MIASTLYEYNARALAPLEKEHISLLKEWRNAQIQILRQYTPLSDYHQREWYAHIKKDKSQVLFAILEKPKNTFIGYCGITNIDFKNRRGEVSFLVNPERTDKKSLYEKDFHAVLYMLSLYGFGELGFHKLYTETYEFRKEHMVILENFGFTKEGELREHYFAKGRYINSLIHSFLESAWKHYDK